MDKAQRYLSDHEIPKLFESLAIMLIVNKPDNPRHFLVDQLKKIRDTKQKRTRQTAVLLGERQLRTLFCSLDPTQTDFLSLDHVKQVFAILGLTEPDGGFAPLLDARRRLSWERFLQVSTEALQKLHRWLPARVLEAELIWEAEEAARGPPALLNPPARSLLSKIQEHTLFIRIQPEVFEMALKGRKPDDGRIDRNSLEQLFEADLGPAVFGEEAMNHTIPTTVERTFASFAEKSDDGLAGYGELMPAAAILLNIPLDEKMQFGYKLPYDRLGDGCIRRRDAIKFVFWFVVGGIQFAQTLLAKKTAEAETSQVDDDAFLEVMNFSNLYSTRLTPDFCRELVGRAFRTLHQVPLPVEEAAPEDDDDLDPDADEDDEATLLRREERERKREEREERERQEAEEDADGLVGGRDRVLFYEFVEWLKAQECVAEWLKEFVPCFFHGIGSANGSDSAEPSV
eukprot:gnl/Spiro4/6319_TR3251_c0_g1_i1.p1 gnl/Spiro4/6319_TR3251_c0_g1~~gnl/Spiro4/6319_TR3251_c0_g1_i1.p1  ORF type:complete len:456 (+),score=134.16 gnl/Spiro4/6319_TR3251_c0_g1_i1:81-1448(+)